MRPNVSHILQLGITLAIGAACGFSLAHFDRTADIANSLSEPQDARFIPSLGDLPVRNGIDPKVADKFWEHWHFVTSRYRKDNDQTRIIYANDVAWNAMLERKNRYPDGSIFVKAVFTSERDPVFPASVIPKAYKEVQFMKKDNSAYAASAGWGFALYEYSERGVLLRWDEKLAPSVLQSCYSCHTIIERRDHVFALPAFLQWFRSDPSVDDHVFQTKFDLVSYANLSPFAKKVVDHFGGSPTDKVRVYSLKNMVTGERIALDSVAQFALADKSPYLLLGEQPLTFVYVKPRANQKPDQPACAGFAMSSHIISSRVQVGTVCDDTVKIEHAENWP